MQTSKNLNSNVKQRWSLRKLSVGVASVLIGLTFFGGQQVASANGGTPGQTNSQPNVTAPSPTATSSASSTISTDTRAYDAQSPVVPSGYATALQGFRPGPAGQTQTEPSALMHVSQEGKAADTNNPNQSVSLVGINTATNGTTTVTFNVKYNSNSRDENMVVDPLHLTTAQQSNLTNFAAQTINQIRQQVQAQPNGSTVSVGYLKVSPYSTQVGNNIVASAYNNFPAGGHNMTGLAAAARSEGINAWVGENIGSVGGLMVLQIQKQGLLRNITMNDLKQEVYADIIQMMYQDNNNNLGAGGHTTAQLNDPYYNANSIQGGNAIALDRDGHLISGANQYLALTIDNKGQVHFNFISDADATAAVKHALAQNAVTPLGFVTETTSGSSASSTTSSAASSATNSAATSAHSSAASSSSSATSSAATSAHSSAVSSAVSSAASNVHSSAASSASSAVSSAASSAHSAAVSSVVSSAASNAHSSAASSSSNTASSATSSSSSATSSAASSVTSSVDSNAASSMNSASPDNSSSASASNSPINTNSASANSESLSGNQATASSNGQVSSSAASANRNSAASEVVDSTAASQVNTVNNAQRSSLTVSTSTSASANAKGLNLGDDNSNVTENNVALASSKNATAKSGTQNNQLPQTGNDTKTFSLIGLVAAAATTAMAMLSFNKKRDY